MTTSVLRRLGMAAAVFGLVLSGAAAAHADSNNPFGPNVPYAPPSGPNPTVNPNNDRPFARPSQPQRQQFKSVKHYLLGVWSGHLKDGSSIRLTFSRDGKFSLVNLSKGFAVVGYFRVQGLNIRLVGVGVCRANGCQRWPQQKAVTMTIKPLSANAMMTPTGRLQRAA